MAIEEPIDWLSLGEEAEIAAQASRQTTEQKNTTAGLAEAEKLLAEVQALIKAERKAKVEELTERFRQAPPGSDLKEVLTEEEQAILEAALAAELTRALGIEKGQADANRARKAVPQKEILDIEVLKVKKKKRPDLTLEEDIAKTEADTMAAVELATSDDDVKSRIAIIDTLRKRKEEILKLSALSQITIIVGALGEIVYYSLILKEFLDLLKRPELYIALAKAGKIEVAEAWIDKQIADPKRNWLLPFEGKTKEEKKAAFLDSVTSNIINEMEALKPVDFRTLDQRSQQIIVVRQKFQCFGENMIGELNIQQQARILAEYTEDINCADLLQEFGYIPEFGFFLAVLMRGKAYLLQNDRMKDVIQNLVEKNQLSTAEQGMIEADLAQGEKSQLLNCNDEVTMRACLEQMGLNRMAETYDLFLKEGVFRGPQSKK